MVLKVAVNGYGNIGKRVADAVAKQDDMLLVGVSKTRPNFEAFTAVEKGIPCMLPNLKKLGDLKPLGWMLHERQWI